MGVMVKQSELLDEVKDLLRQVLPSLGGITEPIRNGFWSLVRDFYLAETKIPIKYKELMAVAAAVASRCRSSQLLHSEIARLHGASEEEIAEACAMGGVTVMGNVYFEAAGIDYETVRQETLRMAEHVQGSRPETGAGI